MLRKSLGKLSRAVYRATIKGLSTGPHITRYFMYRHLSQYRKPRSGDLNVLSIGHSEVLASLLGFSPNQITDASYPEINVLNLPFENNAFDAVVSDQVLEHVAGDPQLAINEMFRVLKPNGISLQTTCFINPVHGYPYDFWRFTPEALELLTAKHGDILDVGGWGNPYVWPFAFIGLRLQPIPHARWHPAHWLAEKNNPQWPIVTWALNKKHAA